MRYSYILNISLYWNFNTSYQDIRRHLIVCNLIDKFLNFCHPPRSLPLLHPPHPFLLRIHIAQVITEYTELESVNKIFGEPIGRAHVELQIDCHFVNDGSHPMHFSPYPSQSKRHTRICEFIQGPVYSVYYFLNFFGRTYSPLN